MIYCGGEYGTFLRSVIPIPTLTNATVYVNITTGSDVTTEQVIWALNTYLPYKLYIKDGLLQFRSAYNIINSDYCRWTVSISANTRYSIGIKTDFSDAQTTPVMYINGEVASLTEAAAAGRAHAHWSDYVTIGGELSFVDTLVNTETKKFLGKISNFVIASTLHSAGEMERATKGRIMRANEILNNTAIMLDCPMDEIADGVNINTYSLLRFTSDITGTWETKTQATYYDSVNEDNGTDYARATKNDDGEALVLGFASSPYTKQGTIHAIDVIVKGAIATNGQCYVRIKKGETWSSQWSCAFTGTTAEAFISFYGDWTQAEIDGMQVELDVPSSMGKDDSVTIYSVHINVFDNIRKVRDYSGNGYHFMGKNAWGRGEDYCTYVA